MADQLFSKLVVIQSMGNKKLYVRRMPGSCFSPRLYLCHFAILALLLLKQKCSTLTIDCAKWEHNKVAHNKALQTGPWTTFVVMSTSRAAPF